MDTTIGILASRERARVCRQPLHSTTLATIMGLFGKSSDSSDSKIIEGQAISSYVDVSTFTMKRSDGLET
jgi:hypothetical protein